MAEQDPTESQDRRDYIEIVIGDGRNTRIFVKNFAETTIERIKSILEWEFTARKMR